MVARLFARTHLLSSAATLPLPHPPRVQATLIASLERGKADLAGRLREAQGSAETLRQLAAAHVSAYGRLAGHTATLHTTFRQQLASLLALCRHSALQLDSALAAADPLPALEQERAVHPAGVRAALEALDGLRTELRIAVALLEGQASGAEARQLAEVPASVAASLQQELAGLAERDLSLLPAPRQPAQGPATSAAASAPPACGDECGTGEPPAAALCAQVGAMESGLEALLHRNGELRARAEAAAALQAAEQEARRRAQDLAATLTADLVACQAQLAAAQGERGELERRCGDLSKQLRDAIYTISQLQAASRGQAASWALRGLRSSAAQTQYCELWVRTVADDPGCPDAAAAAAAEQPAQGVDCVPTAAAAAPAASSPRPLALPELRRLIADVYQAKAVADIAAARGMRPFQPLDKFLDTYLAQQHGPGSAAAAARHEALHLGVEAYAGNVGEVALFGLSAGLLAEAGGGCLASTRGRPCAASSAGAAVPLVLYHSRREAPPDAHTAALPALRRFCHGRWHAAHLASRGRAAAAFRPAAALHAICGEVAALVAAAPGAESLLRWAAGGGAGAVLGEAGLELGLPLAEDQARPATINCST